MKVKFPKAHSKELIEILFRFPYTKRQYLIDAKLGTPKTVSNYLRALEQAGFFKISQGRKRETESQFPINGSLGNELKKWAIRVVYHVG